MEDTKYIPGGVKVVQETGDWQTTPKIGVRMTPGDCAAEMELTQMLYENDNDACEQYLELSLGQMITLRDVLNAKIKELDAK